MSWIISDLEASGFKLSLSGENLRIRPTPGPELLAAIRAHKSELVALLRQRAEEAQESSPSGGQQQPANDFPRTTGAAAVEPEPIHQIDGEEAFEERSAIIQHDGGIPQAWAEGAARLMSMSRPRDIAAKHWNGIIRATGLFLDQWAVKAAALGWTTEEIFGAHATAPMSRYGCRGLVFALADESRTLEEMTPEIATIRTRTGARQNFRKGYFNMDNSPIRALWDRGGEEEVK